MNYDQIITDLVEAIKADKSLMQPFKNYATSDLLRVQAVVRMANQTTLLEPPIDAVKGFDKPDCSCPEGAIDVHCPIHGPIAPVSS